MLFFSFLFGTAMLRNHSWTGANTTGATGANTDANTTDATDANTTDATDANTDANQTDANQTDANTTCANIIIPCGVSLFSEVYDRNKLLSHGKYVVAYEDEWNSIGKGKLLTVNPGTKLPDEWLCSNSFTLFSTEALLSVLLTLVRALKHNGCTHANVLLGAQNSQMVLLYSSGRGRGDVYGSVFGDTLGTLMGLASLNDVCVNSSLFVPEAFYFDGDTHTFHGVYVVGCIDARVVDVVYVEQMFHSCLSFLNLLMDPEGGEAGPTLYAAFMSNFTTLVPSIPLTSSSCFPLVDVAEIALRVGTRASVHPMLTSFVPVVSCTGSALFVLRQDAGGGGKNTFVMAPPGADHDCAALRLEARKLLTRAEAAPLQPADAFFDKSTVLVECMELSSLFEPIKQVLSSLALCADPLAWVQTLVDTGNSLVWAIGIRRARDIVQRQISQSDLLARLSDASLCARECDGFIFDILFCSPPHGASASTLCESLPPEWSPQEFYAVGDSGFLSMLYLLQWRSSLQRFIELALTANIDGTQGLLSGLLTSFRVGILWDFNTESPPVQSYVREVLTASGEKNYIFFFNPSSSSMILKPYNSTNYKDAVSPDWIVRGSLQTQCAKQRDSIIAFFTAQAVSLVSKLIDSVAGASSGNTACALIGMYLGSLNRVDLKHTYKHWQRVIRELRQSIPSKKRRAVSPVVSRTKPSKKTKRSGR